ncbi:MAG: class IV adenylate cyclase [Patescibacteria group bacterium]
MGDSEKSVLSEQDFHHEIERKFTVATLPDALLSFPHFTITQSYLGNGVRLRKINEDEYFLTEKVGTGLDRPEKETPITQKQYQQKLLEANGGTIIKERYIIEHNGRKIDLDVYGGALEGLIIAEIEFDSVEESKSYFPPGWFGGEVTGQEAYANENLAKNQKAPSDLDKRRDLSAPEAIIVPEKSLTEGIKSLMEMIKAEKETKKDGPIFVMVSGRTSSGKTSAVTAEIQRKYGEKVSVLSMDDYSKGNKFIADMAERGVLINWDHPLYMDFELIRKHLSELKQGKAIDKPVFSFKTGEKEGTESFLPNDIIIVEGLFALRDEIQDLGDVKAFVDISLHGSIVRRILRDVVRTNMDPAQILSYYLKIVEPMYQEHIAPTKKNADLVLLNEYNPLNEAARSGLFEVQAKFKEVDMKERLRKAGAEFLNQIHQEDLYIIPKDKDIRASGELVRIRRQDGKIYFAYKGPKTIGDVRIRPKFEFEIDEETAKAIFDRYADKGITVIKQRETYLYDGVIVALDSVMKKSGEDQVSLGDFVEIRTNDRKNGEAKLKSVCERLGIAYDRKITASYFEM